MNLNNHKLNMTRDIDDESYPEKKRRIYHCKDRMCGAEDCATCYPLTYDQAQNGDEREEIEIGDFVIYANHPYQVADISNPIHIGIYDEPPSSHVDYVKWENVRLATLADVRGK